MFHEDINCAASNPCENGGNCTVSNNTCACADGFGGNDCSIGKLDFESNKHDKILKECIKTLKDTYIC